MSIPGDYQSAEDAAQEALGVWFRTIIFKRCDTLPLEMTRELARRREESRRGSHEWPRHKGLMSNTVHMGDKKVGV
jgi:hypothetical protein